MPPSPAIGEGGDKVGGKLKYFYLGSKPDFRIRVNVLREKR
jgi:hypothetical protein